MRPVHFLFCPSGAGSLRYALSQSGPSPEVLTLFDDLSFGPLNPKRRAEWWRENFDDEDKNDHEDTISRLEARFWTMASSVEVEPIVWVNRTSPQERTGLLAFIVNTGGRPFRLIDVTDIKFQDSYQAGLASPTSIGSFLPRTLSEILRNNEPAFADPRLVQESLADWERLMEEDAILRIVDANGQLVSVSDDYFDRWILRFVGDQWTRANRVVGEALDAYHREFRRSIGDLFPSRRLQLLAEASIVEVKGTLGVLHEYSVRLPHRIFTDDSHNALD
ncbi:DUF3658 domain-containing protein [Burkholderia sp. PAMC 26561]|uniref:DUF3658 domain-containing protein n=1 Tax=Burkholderia sp. PAMC 26561 TaxID=1795043 RepID=UPI00076AF702|nr:DUF3658 domain-containing protein [Burkholderia sp. PAMC 26561]AMH42838.1 hypothetical protein AXG89_41685 [Burkholderia sp. PAMC 26561]